MYTIYQKCAINKFISFQLSKRNTPLRLTALVGSIGRLGRDLGCKKILSSAVAISGRNKELYEICSRTAKTVQ